MGFAQMEFTSVQYLMVLPRCNIEWVILQRNINWFYLSAISIGSYLTTTSNGFYSDEFSISVLRKMGFYLGAISKRFYLSAISNVFFSNGFYINAMLNGLYLSAILNGFLPQCSITWIFSAISNGSCLSAISSNITPRVAHSKRSIRWGNLILTQTLVRLTHFFSPRKCSTFSSLTTSSACLSAMRTRHKASLMTACIHIHPSLSCPGPPGVDTSRRTEPRGLIGS